MALPLLSTLTTETFPTWRVLRNVGAAVGLYVQTDDVDDTDLLLIGRNQVGLGTDDVGQAQRLGAGQHPNIDAPVRHNLGVDELLEPRLEFGWNLGQVEVHAGLTGLHVPAGHEGSEVSEHYST